MQCQALLELEMQPAELNERNAVAAERQRGKGRMAGTGLGFGLVVDERKRRD
jgi:hypothetical protein